MCTSSRAPPSMSYAGDIADVTDLSFPWSPACSVNGSAATVAQAPLLRQAALRALVLAGHAPDRDAQVQAEGSFSTRTPASPTPAPCSNRLAESHRGQAGGPWRAGHSGRDAALEKALATTGAVGRMRSHRTQGPWAKGVIYDALVRALCSELPLSARLHGRGHSLSVSRPEQRAPLWGAGPGQT